MDVQSIIVVVVIVLALGFVGLNLWRKVRSFSAKSACGNDCGCDSKPNKIQIQIRR